MTILCISCGLPEDLCVCEALENEKKFKEHRPALRPEEPKENTPLEPPKEKDDKGPLTHELKIYPGPFQDILEGLKRFEWRKYDRDFRDNDVLLLREWNPTKDEYTGSTQKVKVLQVYSGVFEIPSDYCIMSISFPYDVRFEGI